ncbi:hypothetical protein, partial [Streptomyces albidoflavus]|uniref:hypothetical protein n=1 Tax=Streptomyces albidoflavus TaxID=1886 RepID=UPI001C535466
AKTLTAVSVGVKPVRARVVRQLHEEAADLREAVLARGQRRAADTAPTRQPVRQAGQTGRAGRQSEAALRSIADWAASSVS